MRIFMFLALFLTVMAAPARAGTLDILASGGTGGWVNTTRPLTVDDFKNRVILLDFWTYGCINCMQVIPDLEYLEKKFPQLLVVGVHSAKYKGEGLSDRIKAAAERFGVHHPVMNDNDYKVWEAFDVHAWPTLIVLDGKGQEVSRYAGEGHRNELERDIARAVKGLEMVKSDALVAKAQNNGDFFYPSHIQYAQGTSLGDVFFVGNAGGNNIVVTDEAGNVKTKIGTGVQGFKDGNFASAQFNHPRGIIVVDDVLYVADTDNHALRAVDLKTQKVTTLAGSGKRGYSLFNVYHTSDLASPWDLALMPDGKRIAIAMAGTHQLWVYDIASKYVDTLAGSGRENIRDGAANDAQLAQPSGLSYMDGDLYFVDAETSSLRVLKKDGNVKTLIGTGLFDFGLRDGKYPDAQMQHPQGVFALDGKVYVADTYNNALRVYDIATATLSTVDLQGQTLSEPGDVYVKDGIAYIVSTGGHGVVRVSLK